MYHVRGLKTLDQLTLLATQFYIEDGECGGGSPRFSVVMSNATDKGKQVHVYFGTFPAFTACTTDSWQSTGNLATDTAGLRWDSTQIGGPFYGSYSVAVALANIHGYTLDAILVGIDSGWVFGTQTVYFRDIQVELVTRFPL